jgi:hypothetical protein
METNDFPEQPAHLHLPTLLRWLSALVNIHLIGVSHLPEQGALFVVRQEQIAMLQIVYWQLPDRHGLFAPVMSNEGGIEISAGYLQNGLDALVPLQENVQQAYPELEPALRLARAANAPLLPIGIKAGRSLRLPTSTNRAIPLPATRLVVLIEAPFYVPSQPEQVPDSWLQAIMHSLQRANGQALDTMASWQRQGRLPTLKS